MSSVSRDSRTITINPSSPTVDLGRPPGTRAADTGHQHSLRRRLQGHALALDLRDPGLDALLRLVRLVVLVAREANELVASDRLGLHVVVAVGRPRADDLSALRREAGLELIHGVAEVVAVARLVAQA